MTMIHFNYTDSYANPSRGSLAFMPHRRHAANETEILPKPFTVPLLNGEVTVDLQPNASTWVWIVTEYFEEHAESFYTTVPDKDGVLEHTELTKINPSSIPAPYNAVEPAWWAEIKATKDTVTETLLKSGEALEEAQEAIEVGRESIDRTRENASLAKAYSEQSRDHSYDAREYRDSAEQWRNEAQEQADRAATGPESAAARADASAAAALNSENAARDYENQARTHAAEARTDATTAQTASTNAVEREVSARQHADRSELEANRAQGYADDLLSGPQEYLTQTEAARDAAQGYRDEAQTAATDAQDVIPIVQTTTTQAETARDEALGYRNEAETIVGTIDNNAINLELLNGWTVLNYASNTPYYVTTPWGILLYGVIAGGNTELPLFTLPTTFTKAVRVPVMTSLSSYAMGYLTIETTGEVYIRCESNTPNIVLNGTLIPLRTQ